MSRQLELVQAIFKGFTEENSVETLLANVTEDVLFQNSSHVSVPFAGEFHGPDGILEYFKAVASCLQPHSVRVTDYFENSNGVVVLGDEVLKVLATGVEVPSVWCTAFTFREHLISKIRVIEDHSALISHVTGAA